MKRGRLLNGIPPSFSMFPIRSAPAGASLVPGAERSVRNGDRRMNANVRPSINSSESTRTRKSVREQEILRVVADLQPDSGQQNVFAARNEVLRWAQNKTVGILPQEAWDFKSFERLSGGRSCSVVHLETDEKDIWSLRIEDPDKTVAGRVWTTEINTDFHQEGNVQRFTLRLSASTTESFLKIEPHVPGIVRQVICGPGLWSGEFRLVDQPIRIVSDRAQELFFRALLNPLRKLPIIALSIPENTPQSSEPLLDAKVLAQACAGLALVVIVAPNVSWALTERFGKQLSVYSGAARVYLPGFTEDANPFGGHELLLPYRWEQPEVATQALTRLRWIAANGSVRRLQLGTDILAFSSLKAQELQQRQLVLQNTGATDREQLEAANIRIELLSGQLQQSQNYEQQFSDLHQEAEQRAETAEAQLRASAFRIQQLLSQIEASGVAPDARITLPDNWSDFAIWCDVNLAGRVILAPQARRSIKDAEFEDVGLAARCLLWLANEYRTTKLEGGGALRDAKIENGVLNAHCGNDEYQIDWQGIGHDVEWHVKNGGNTRDPVRCLRIYYFWDETSQQAVVASMPAHRRTDAS
jgi:hypothetical protein